MAEEAEEEDKGRMVLNHHLLANLLPMPNQRKPGRASQPEMRRVEVCPCLRSLLTIIATRYHCRTDNIC